MSSRHETQRREKNAGAVQDWLDANLEQYQPGSIALDEMMFEKKHRGESRVLLREPQLKRLDGEGIANEEESHALLMRLMVEPSSLLAKRHPLYHHDLQSNIFGSPAGYQRLLQMEKSSKTDTRERAENCRAGIEAVLDMLDERGVELAVRRVPTPKWSDFQHTESAHPEMERLPAHRVCSLGAFQAIRRPLPLRLLLPQGSQEGAGKGHQAVLG